MFMADTELSAAARTEGPQSGTIGAAWERERIRRRAVVHGLVQGVWFRDSTRREAAAHGVDGWVRNRPDGTVEAVLEGGEPAVQSRSCSSSGPGRPGRTWRGST